MQDRVIRSPAPTPETEHYWSAAAEGRLLIKQCRSCDRPHFYPRALCPFCFSRETEWRQAEGVGTVYSFSIARRAQVPYVVAYVTLAEGPTMLTNIVDCLADTLHIGQKVRLVFKSSENGQPVPMFTPVN